MALVVGHRFWIMLFGITVVGCAAQSTAIYMVDERASELARLLCTEFDMNREPTDLGGGRLLCEAQHGQPRLIVEAKPELIRVTGHRDDQPLVAMRISQLAQQMGVKVEYLTP